MLPLLILLGLGLLWLVHWTIGGLPAAVQKRIRRALWLIGGVVAFVIMVRLGLIRVAAVGALLLAMLRWLGPLLLRLSPFLLPWLSRRFTRPAEAHDRPDSGESASPPKKTEMTRDEALAILGLTEGATDDEVRVAYAALIKKVHPDQGGSAYLAARVNLARDRLLSKSKR